MQSRLEAFPAALQPLQTVGMHAVYYIYSDEYGQEFEDLIGKQYSEGYTNSELERMTEECLCVNPYIEGITDFECVKKDEKIMLSFKLITTLGEQEAEIYV